jgi:uncharacterized protein with HEPN domain
MFGMSKRYPLLLIEDMLQAVDDISQCVHGLDYEAFSLSREKINSCCFAVQVLGEAASLMPDTIRDTYTAIPWKQVRAYRNRIVHEYFDIDYDFLWQVATLYVPDLKQPLLLLKSQLHTLGDT